MTRTAVNVTGDCMVTAVVALSEKQLDCTIFNNIEAEDKEENSQLNSDSRA